MVFSTKISKRRQLKCEIGSKVDIFGCSMFPSIFSADNFFVPDSLSFFPKTKMILIAKRVFFLHEMKLLARYQACFCNFFCTNFFLLKCFLHVGKFQSAAFCSKCNLVLKLAIRVKCIRSEQASAKLTSAKLQFQSSWMNST